MFDPEAPLDLDELRARLRAMDDPLVISAMPFPGLPIFQVRASWNFGASAPPPSLL
jgi:hypothetical protein